MTTDNDALVLSGKMPESDGSMIPVEIYAQPGTFTFRNGAWIFDGFVIPKNGGMYQGVLVLTLTPAEETAVRLANPKLVEKQF